MAFASDPNRLARAISLASAGRLQEAENAFQLLLATDPGNADVFCYYDHQIDDDVTRRLHTGANGWRQRLAKLREGLRARMERSPLMDDPGFTSALESHYLEIAASHWPMEA